MVEFNLSEKISFKSDLGGILDSGNERIKVRDVKNFIRLFLEELKEEGWIRDSDLNCIEAKLRKLAGEKLT